MTKEEEVAIKQWKIYIHSLKAQAIDEMIDFLSDKKDTVIMKMLVKEKIKRV